MTIKRRGFIKSASAGAIAVSAPAIIGRAAAQDTIKAASIVDQSGGLDIYGRPMANTIEMAVDEINAAGGLLDKQLELISYDPQSSIQFYTQYATQAATSDQVAVVHGGITSASLSLIHI